VEWCKIELEYAAGVFALTGAEPAAAAAALLAAIDDDVADKYHQLAQDHDSE
jgi:hypothetical protein